MGLGIAHKLILSGKHNKITQQNITDMAKQTVSFDDDNLVAQDLPYLKMKKGETLRVHIPQINNILMFHQHCLKDSADNFVGYARCYEDKEEKCPICEITGNEPVTRMRTNVIVYTGTNDDGSVEDPSTTGCKHYVLKFGLSLFAQLKAKHKKAAKKGGLAGIDLTFACSDEKFQKITVDDCSDDCLATSDLKAKVAKVIEEKFVDFSNYDDRDLKYTTGVKLDDLLSKATDGKYQAGNSAATHAVNNASFSKADSDESSDDEDAANLFGGPAGGSEDDEDSLGGLL